MISILYVLTILYMSLCIYVFRTMFIINKKNISDEFNFWYHEYLGLLQRPKTENYFLNIEASPLQIGSCGWKSGRFVKKKNKTR